MHCLQLIEIEQELRKMSNNAGVITFLDYRVVNVEFKLNQEFNGEEEIDLEINVESDRVISDDGKQMVITLKLHVFDDKSESYPFTMFVELHGLFELSEEVDEKNIKQYYTNALAILYPYARTIVSNYTASANIEPVILPTINITKMINEDEKK